MLIMDSNDLEGQLPPIFSDSELWKLEIKESLIPGAGMGLFTTKPIKQGQYIAQYYGAIIPGKYSFSQPFMMEDKMVYLNKRYCVISRSPASRANDIVEWNPKQFFSEENAENRDRKILPTVQNKNRNASIQLPSKDKAFLRAERNIEIGEEIHIDYGFQYWEFFMRAANSQNP